MVRVVETIWVGTGVAVKAGGRFTPSTPTPAGTGLGRRGVLGGFQNPGATDGKLINAISTKIVN